MRVCQASIPPKLHGFELRAAFRLAPSFRGLCCPAATRCDVQVPREGKGSAAVPVRLPSCRFPPDRSTGGYALSIQTLARSCGTSLQMIHWSPGSAFMTKNEMRPAHAWRRCFHEVD